MIEPKTRGLIGPQLQASSRHLSFGGQLAQFAKLVDKRINVVHRDLSIKLFSRIVLDTPVDTGEARGGWNASMGMPDLRETGRIDTTGEAAIRDIEASIKADRSKIAYLSNSVGHIIPLEYGWSKQQPEGMVRINIARFQTLIKEAVESAKRKDQ